MSQLYLLSNTFPSDLTDEREENQEKYSNVNQLIISEDCNEPELEESIKPELTKTALERSTKTELTKIELAKTELEESTKTELEEPTKTELTKTELAKTELEESTKPESTKPESTKPEESTKPKSNKLVSDSTPDVVVSGFTSPVVPISIQTMYKKLPAQQETFLAYVVAIRDPLNIHLDIYWSPEIEKKYLDALHYDYTFVSEELGSSIQTRRAYSCHLRGVEIISDNEDEIGNMKEAHILVSTQIYSSNGWVLVTVSDIDIYQRVLVNMFDIIDRKSINKKLLDYRSTRLTNAPIAKEYIRPFKKNHQNLFSPSSKAPSGNYSIVYNPDKSNGQPSYYRDRFSRSEADEKSWRKKV